MNQVRILSDDFIALYKESARLGEAEKKRLQECGIKIKPSDEAVTIGIQELMANECS